MLDDYESEEDEDFKSDDGGSGSDDDESGEEDQDGSDEDMIDEGVDKEELKHLQKGVELKEGKRRRGDK